MERLNRTGTNRFQRVGFIIGYFQVSSFLAATLARAFAVFQSDVVGFCKIRTKSGSVGTLKGLSELLVGHHDSVT